MKILKSFSFIAVVALTIGSIFGMIKGLSTLCLCLGFGELVKAKEYYDNKQKKLATTNLILGVCICICAILSFTNFI